MHHFEYKAGEFFAEGVPLSKIANEVGTPTYVYSYRTIERHYQVFSEAFAGLTHQICFSMKSNSNLALLRAFAKWGSGVDIVSGGELFRALKAGVDPKKIVFSGVGKTSAEMVAALEAGILMFNVESEAELLALDQVAQSLKKKAPVSLRINPNVDPKTHPYVSTGLKKSKFGIQFDQALPVYKHCLSLKGIKVVGIDCHIGSQLTETEPFVAALQRLLDLYHQLTKMGFKIKYLDLGGGLGIRYQEENPPLPHEYARALKKELQGLPVTLIFEPGRVLLGNAGVLLTQMLYQKNRDDKTFLIVDAAMNDLIRPAFYKSYHQILPLQERVRPEIVADIVGPICESGDFLALDRKTPSYAPGEYMAIMSAGAYGFVMGSNYNSRPRAAEVLVKDEKYFVIRKRETLEDLVRGESIPAFLTSRLS
ncbi:MAG: diaminopimelate decarboxylase [Deltaproteobacteria bacterium]|nr:diaminopimelate decarboxylase [Deltaproteobacteria bacterium]